MRGDDSEDSAADGAVDLIDFFRALRPDARSDYQALAAKDLEFGEDVTAERKANAVRP